MQQWASIFLFSRVGDHRLEELRATVENCDVVWMFADYKHALEAFRPMKDALKGKNSRSLQGNGYTLGSCMNAFRN
jgi:hypothetical protein